MGRSRETWPRLRGTTPNESGRQTGPSGGVWLWVLRVRSGAALAGNEDGHDDDADADADAARSNDGARRRNRRGRSALISLRSAPIFPLPLASTPLAPPLASPSFFPTFSPLPPSLSLSLSLSLHPNSPRLTLRPHLPTTISILQERPCVCRVPFASAERRLRIALPLRYFAGEKIHRDIRCFVPMLPPLTRCSFAGIDGSVLIVAPSSKSNALKKRRKCFVVLKKVKFAWTDFIIVRGEGFLWSWLWLFKEMLNEKRHVEAKIIYS